LPIPPGKFRPGALKQFQRPASSVHRELFSGTPKSAKDPQRCDAAESPAALSTRADEKNRFTNVMGVIEERHCFGMIGLIPIGRAGQGSIL
jgi:hypothetical protein